MLIGEDDACIVVGLPDAQITNLSKIYRPGEIGTGTINRDVEHWYRMRVRGREDSFLKIGENNVSRKKG